EEARRRMLPATAMRPSGCGGMGPSRCSPLLGDERASPASRLRRSGPMALATRPPQSSATGCHENGRRSFNYSALRLTIFVQRGGRPSGRVCLLGHEFLLFSARDVLRKPKTFELFAACDSCERGVRCAKGAKLSGDILDHFLEISIKPSGFDDPETAHLYDLFSGLQQHIETPLISEQRKDRFNVLFVNAPRIIRATLRRQVYRVPKEVIHYEKARTISCGSNARCCSRRTQWMQQCPAAPRQGPQGLRRQCLFP